MNRVIAIDWSGDKSKAQSKIWLAEVREGRLTRLESGRNRNEIVAHLIREASADPDFVVGLDFSFSFPRWYMEKLGATRVEELWKLVADEGEEWLRIGECPFWGRAGKKKPNLPEHFRVTEQQASEVKGVNPKSVFQIGGGGAVGTGSIRGIPHLMALRESGFSIWPFGEAQTPLVLEIYPRLLSGRVNKADFDEREAYLAKCCPEVDYRLACKAASSEDAFDAVVSAIVMSRHVNEISNLKASQQGTDLTEGKIWWPREIRDGGAKTHNDAGRSAECPFCHIREASVVDESRHAFAIEDQFPVSLGHTLLIPKCHAETLFSQRPDIQADIWRLLASVRVKLQSRFNPDGFNVGLNEGEAAGQTVEHAHIHIIPRYDRDVADPRGGIRWVLPNRAAYWDR